MNSDVINELQEELTMWEKFSQVDSAYVEQVVLHSEDWNEIKSHILLVGERDIYSPALLFRLVELALEHRDDDPDVENEQKVTNKMAVLNAICTVGCRVPRQHMFMLWPFLETGHKIDTSCEAMRRLYRYMEAQPCKRMDEHIFLTEQMAHLAIDHIQSGRMLAKTDVFAMLTVDALCASGCSNALRHIKTVLELPRIRDLAPYFPWRDILEMRGNWISMIESGNKRAPCASAVGNLNDCVNYFRKVSPIFDKMCLHEKEL